MERQRRTTEKHPDGHTEGTLFRLNRRTAFPHPLAPKDGHYLRRARFRGETLTLVLILKGPGQSMALSSLWKREINMFLKAKQAACGVCVWASLTPADALSEILRLRRNDHVSRSSAAIFTAARITTVLSGECASLRDCVTACLVGLSSF